MRIDTRVRGERRRDLRCILVSLAYCRRKKLLLRRSMFHKAVAVNGWEGMISHDVEIGCPHCAHVLRLPLA